MKKTLALILALVLVLALCACGGKTAAPDTPAPATDAPATAAPATDAPATDAPTGPADQPSAEGKPYPNCNPDGSINLDTIAHFDPEYDYYQNPRFKICYIATSSGPLYQEAAKAYENWCNARNLEWMGFSSSEGDNDLFLTLMQNQIDQGVDLMFLDPDSLIFPAVVSLMDQYPDVAWMSQMSPARDGETGAGIPAGGNLMHPFVGFDFYDVGLWQMEKLFQWMDENYPDADWSEVGLLCMDYSLVPALHDRVPAGQDYWKANAPAEAQQNIFIGDCAATGLTMQAGLDIAGPIISTNGQIKYWLVQGNIDDWAQGAASAIEQAGLSETSCVVCNGGAGLQMQWDAGQENCFRYANYTANILYTEPLIGAAYAFKMGWATPENIWPSWINWNDCGGEGHTYASRRLPVVWLEHENYKNYLEWCDLYAGTQIYNYDNDVTVAIDDFTSMVDEVPASYAKQ